MSTLNKYINQAFACSDNKNCENINWSQEKSRTAYCLIEYWEIIWILLHYKTTLPSTPMKLHALIT